MEACPVCDLLGAGVPGPRSSVLSQVQPAHSSVFLGGESLVSLAERPDVLVTRRVKQQELRVQRGWMAWMRGQGAPLGLWAWHQMCSGGGEEVTLVPGRSVEGRAHLRISL